MTALLTLSLATVFGACSPVTAAEPKYLRPPTKWTAVLPCDPKTWKGSVTLVLSSEEHYHPPKALMERFFQLASREEALVGIETRIGWGYGRPLAETRNVEWKTDARRDGYSPARALGAILAMQVSLAQGFPLSVANLFFREPDAGLFLSTLPKLDDEDAEELRSAVVRNADELAKYVSETKDKIELIDRKESAAYRKFSSELKWIDDKQRVARAALILYERVNEAFLREWTSRETEGPAPKPTEAYLKWVRQAPRALLEVDRRRTADFEAFYAETAAAINAWRDRYMAQTALRMVCEAATRGIATVILHSGYAHTPGIFFLTDKAMEIAGIGDKGKVLVELSILEQARWWPDRHKAPDYDGLEKARGFFDKSNIPQRARVDATIYGR